MPSDGRISQLTIPVLEDGTVSDKTYDLPGGGGDVSGKADKVSNATSGNFAGLDSSGNLTDSGKKASDFAASSHTHTKNQITDFPTLGAAAAKDSTNAVTQNSTALVESGAVYSYIDTVITQALTASY